MVDSSETNLPSFSRIRIDSIGHSAKSSEHKNERKNHGKKVSKAMYGYHMRDHVRRIDFVCVYVTEKPTSARPGTAVQHQHDQKNSEGGRKRRSEDYRLGEVKFHEWFIDI